MRRVSSSNSWTYASTDSRHSSTNLATPIFSSIARFPEIPRRFSTSTSTGSPWVSHPARRTTTRPRIDWYRQKRSL